MTSWVFRLLWLLPFASSSPLSLLSPLKPSISREDDQTLNSLIFIYTRIQTSSIVYLYIGAFIPKKARDRSSFLSHYMYGINKACVVWCCVLCSLSSITITDHEPQAFEIYGDTVL